jgi:Heterokaryon incompatibility protein (HET)
VPLRPASVPTRLIEVGALAAPVLRLVESSSLPEEERNATKYIALSYPWGRSPPHEHFITNQQNVEAYKIEIPNKLPPTLADAVKTTRHLNIRYLWINSLCIIQGPSGDFAEQAGRMGAVFSSEYCVLAATSANGTSSGFLNRTPKRELGAVIDRNDEGVNPVYFKNTSVDGKRGGMILVDERFDDFDRDVLKSPLNQRGWVFQESALARRTVHLTNNQTCFECGQGIRCETLTKMRNTRVGILGDPNFPIYGLQSSKGGFLFFYEGLYELYSKLSFSNIEDRLFAISGLEQRLG